MAGLRALLAAGACSLFSICVFAAPTDTYLLFSGQSSGTADFLDITADASLDLQNGTFTVSAWINPASLGENDQGRIIDHGGGSGPPEGFSFHLANSGATNTGGLRIQINNDLSFVGLSDPDVVSLAEWQHVAVTLANQAITFYVNGDFAGSVPNAATPNPSNTPVRIGARSTDLKRGFEGSIDEVRLWSRALSQNEIRASMDAEITGTEAGLVAYYRMNAASGQIVDDDSGNGRVAVLGSLPQADPNDPQWQTTVVTNQAPSVDAGSDSEIVLPTNSVQLGGTVVDDNFPSNPLLVRWSLDSGPAEVSYSDESDVNAVVSFPMAGLYTLRLTAEDGEFSAADTLTVTVHSEPVLTSIAIIPGSAFLQFGESQQFSAEGFDQAGSPIPVVPTWTAAGGTISPAGLYTAPNSPGTYTITATAGSVSASASAFVASSETWPTNGWENATPSQMQMDAVLLAEARDFALSGGGSGMITRSGKLVMSWGDLTQRYDLKSTTKSIGGSVIGLALQDNLVSLDDLAQQHFADIGLPPPENSSTGWLDDITIRHLATHTAGFDTNSGYGDLLFVPGSAWAYSNGGSNWLADLFTVKYATDLHDLLNSRIFSQIGIQAPDLTWRDNIFREQELNGIARREFASGILASVDAMARIGYLYLRNGQWEGQSLLPAAFVQQASQPVAGIAGLPSLDPASFPSASDHYGLLWWNNADATMPDVPTDAYWSWGLFESLILVIPSLDIVAARAGDGWRSGWDGNYPVIEPFIAPIALSTQTQTNQPPQVDAGVDQGIRLPEDTVSLDGTVSDDGLPDGTLATRWRVLSGPGTVLFGDDTAVDTSASFDTPGSYLLQLEADDGEFVPTDTLTVTVEAAAVLSTLSVAPAAATLAPGESQAFTATGDNQYGEPIAVNPVWTATGGSIDASGLFVAGTLDGDFLVTATDGSVSGHATVAIATPNQAPLVDAGVDQSVQLPEDTVSLDGTASDDGLPDGTLDTRWQLLSGPGTVLFGDDTAVDTSASFGSPGSYLLQLEADDGALTSDDTVSVTLLPEPDTEAPTVTLTAPLEGQTVSGQVTLVAEANDNVAVASVGFAVGTTALGTVGSPPYALNWDSSGLADGAYTISATATDTSGNTAATAVNVTVDNTSVTNQPPQVDAGVDQGIRLPQDTVSLDGTVSDDGLPDGTLATRWRVLSGPGTVLFGDDTAVDTSASFSTPGSYLLQLEADDGEFVPTDTLTVTVEAAAVLSTLSVAPADVSLAASESQAFTATGDNQYGEPIAVNPVWTATGGSIDASGLFVAGTLDGDFLVTATEGSVSGQAAVAIASSTSQPTTDHLLFDGNNDVAIAADHASLDITTAITLEAWIRPDALSDSRSQDRVIHKEIDYELTVSTGDTGCHFGSNGDVQWRATIDGSNRRICGGVLTPGVWHHIAGTYDGSEVVLYVDGAAVASAPRSGAIATNTLPLHLGNRPQGDRPLDGALDEVRLWNRALSAAEIAANRDIELSGSESGLVIYFSLNEGSGQTAFDTSPTTNHGTLGSSNNVEANDPVWIAN